MVSAGLLALVVSQIDLGKVGTRLSSGRWELFAAAVVSVFLSFLIAAFRWQLFLRAAGIARTQSEVTRAYLLGAFTNNFLPSQFGGDVTRAWMASSPGLRVPAAATVVIDRATGLACLVLAAWLAFGFNPGPVPGSLVAPLGLASAGLVAAAVVAAAVVGGVGWSGWLQGRFGGFARETIAATRACMHRSVAGRALILGLAFQGLILLEVWLLARSISLHTPFSVLAVTVPTVLILSALPVSIGGFGVREASFVLLLDRAGVSSTDATVLSLLTATAAAVASLPGALGLLRPGLSARSTQSQDREQERGEEDLDAGDQHGRGDQRPFAPAEGPEPFDDPAGRDDHPGDEAEDDQPTAQQ